MVPHARHMSVSSIISRPPSWSFWKSLRIHMFFLVLLATAFIGSQPFSAMEM